MSSETGSPVEKITIAGDMLEVKQEDLHALNKVNEQGNVMSSRDQMIYIMTHMSKAPGRWEINDSDYSYNEAPMNFDSLEIGDEEKSILKQKFDILANYVNIPYIFDGFPNTYEGDMARRDWFVKMSSIFEGTDFADLSRANKLKWNRISEVIESLDYIPMYVGFSEKADKIISLSERLKLKIEEILKPRPGIEGLDKSKAFYNAYEDNNAKMVNTYAEKKNDAKKTTASSIAAETKQYLTAVQKVLLEP